MRNNSDRITVKAYKVSGSIRVAIPASIAKLKGIRHGDVLEWIEDRGDLIIRKVEDK